LALNILCTTQFVTSITVRYWQHSAMGECICCLRCLLAPSAVAMYEINTQHHTPANKI